MLALLALATSCKQEEKPAPTGSGMTDIFGSAPVPPEAGAADAAPPVEAGASGPLLRFMKGELATAFAAKKGAAVAASYEKLAKVAPAGYANWASICKDGADAAKAGDWNGVKATCRGCHGQYKDQYGAEHRGEALP